MSKAFWQEVESLLETIPKLELEYRFYYDETGNITSCSMQDHAPGDYIVVTKDEYERYFQYKIVKGCLKKIDHDSGYRVQLAKSTQGFLVVRGHAGLLIEDEEYNDVEYYARTN